MDRARADAHNPNLRVGKTTSQALTRLQFICINLVNASLDVDGDKLTVVLGLEMREDIVLVNGVAATGELFFAIPALGRGHKHPPILPNVHARGDSFVLYLA